MVVWKSVECLHTHLAFSFFNMKITDSAVGNPTARIKRLQQFALAVATLELRLHHPEHVRGDGFALTLGRIANSCVTFYFLVELSAKRRSDNAATLGKHLFAGAHHFRNNRVPFHKRNDMPIASNVDASRVVRSLNQSRPIDMKKFWVNRSSEYVKCMLSDGRSNR